MIREKKKLLFHRLFWFVLLLLVIIIPIITIRALIEDNDIIFEMTMSIFLYLDIVIFVFFICSLTLSYKKYDYSGNEIIVYAGWFHHYIKVNGMKMDEHNTLTSWNAISLSCTLDDGTHLKATISLSNRISLKINDRLYKNK